MAWTTPRGTVFIALAGNFASAIAKIAAFVASGSSALLSEAIHSLATITHQILLLVGLEQTERPADARHAFGHAKEIYFWAFIAAILLFSHGAGVAIYEGIQKFKNPPYLSITEWTYLALAGALAVQVGILLFLRKAPHLPADASKPVSTALTVEAYAGIAGTSLAIAGIFAADHLGMRYADALASLAVGFVMAATAAFMSLKIKSVIVGKSAGPGVRSAIRTLIGAETAPGRAIAAVHDVRTLQLGLDDVLVAANVTFREGETALAVEETTIRLDRAIKAQLPQVSYVFLAAHPGKLPDHEDGDHGDGEHGTAEHWDDVETLEAPAVTRPTSAAAPHRHEPNRKRRKKRRH